MEFDGDFSVSASPAETWEFLLSPDRLGGSIPNCQNINVIDDTHYTAEIRISVSHVSAAFDADIEILERRPEEYLKVRVAGAAMEGDSRMSATGELWMQARDDGGTDLEYKNEVDVTGRLMNMGSRIVKSVGQRITKKTIDNIQESLGRVDA